MQTVCGLDLSLTASGIASSHGWLELRGRKGHNDDAWPVRRDRINATADQVWELARQHDVIVIETPAPSKAFGHVWDRAGLWWQIVNKAISTERTVGLVGPKQLKEFATGNGNASKELVVAAVNMVRVPMGHDPIKDDNLADAWWLMTMGRVFQDIGPKASDRQWDILRRCTWV